MKPIITAQLEIAVLGTGSTSMSAHITEAVRAIEKSGVKYQLNPMGTTLEAASLDEIFRATGAAHEALAKKGINRVVSHITIDDRRDAPKDMEEKVESVKNKL